MKNMTIKIHHQRISAIITCFGLSIGTLIVSIIGIARGNPFLIILLPVSGVCLYLGIYSLRDKAPRVILDEEGINAREWGNTKVLWGDIKRVYTVNVPRLDVFIALELHEPARYSFVINEIGKTTVTMKNIYGLSLFSFKTFGLDMNISLIYQEIQSRISKANKELAEETDRLDC